jgi:predicted helicase
MAHCTSLAHCEPAYKKRAGSIPSFKEHQAVQYFYEPFLEAYDPELRKELGVWYTPREIVRYMVERVDRVLRAELGVEDGLAAKNVLVLDPCCGTGAYLIEVLRKIAQTVKEHGGGAIAGLEAKQAAIERVFGFEILSAPFVIAHLQIGMTLQDLGVSLVDDERASVYLTNSLIGWEPPKGSKKQLSLVFPELLQEQKAASDVKQEKKILVILGNPPYNAFAGVSTEAEGQLVDVYKEGLISEWGIKKFNLDELYVRFFRLAEKRIAEKTGQGVVAYISNGSWITDPSFVVMRKHLLNSFDSFWIENLHGNRKMSEYAPDGRTSETVFAIAGFSPGIQQGVATSLWVKNGKSSAKPRVLFRDDISAAKADERRAHLLHSLNADDFDSLYSEASPSVHNRYSFRPSDIAEQYLGWPRVIDLCAEQPSYGLMEKRGGALIDINRLSLEQRMRAYLNPVLTWEQYRDTGYGLVRAQARFDPKAARLRALNEGFKIENIVRYAVRPFDTRWAYYIGVRPVWNEPRPQLWTQCWKGNAFLLVRFRAAKEPEGPPCFYTTVLCDDHILSPDAVAIPLWLKDKNHVTLPNLSLSIAEYLLQIGFSAEQDGDSSEAIWMHVLAVSYAPSYLIENGNGVRQDWPRIPLPTSKDLLVKSAELGRQIAGLLNTESEVAGITAGAIRTELIGIASVVRDQDAALNESKGELDLRGWGHLGKDGAVMPGAGRVRARDYSDYEIATIEAGTKALGLDRQTTLRLLGDHTVDLWLNEVAFFRNVPSRVWEYTIGGYQVIKKWLSYRDKKVLDRSLVLEELKEVTATARRIAAILLLEPKLDANYMAVKSAYEMADNAKG